MTNKKQKEETQKKGDPGPTPKAESKAPAARKPREDLYPRLARVLAKIEMIPKEGRNDFHEYDYVKEDTLTEQIRPMLADEGISLIFGAEEVILAENCITLVRCTFTLGCDFGEPITTTVWGAGRDADSKGNRGDKGIYKAMTGAMKYFLYKTFLVSTGDDVEIEPPAGDQGLRITPGQVKELAKFKGDERLDEEVKKWIAKMIDDGGSQAAAGRIIAEAKKQIQAFTAKQKEALDAEEKGEEGEPDKPGHEPDQHPREEPMDDDDIPF
jgi:hypothetical protein